MITFFFLVKYQLCFISCTQVGNIEKPKPVADGRSALLDQIKKGKHRIYYSHHCLRFFQQLCLHFTIIGKALKRVSDIDQEPDEKISVTGKDGSLTSALLGALENINQHNLYSDSDEEDDDQDDDDEWSD